MWCKSFLEWVFGRLKMGSWPPRTFIGFMILLKGKYMVMYLYRKMSDHWLFFRLIVIYTMAYKFLAVDLAMLIWKGFPNMEWFILPLSSLLVAIYILYC